MNYETILQDIIQIQSYSGNEQKLAAYIKNFCKNKNVILTEHKENIIIHINKGSNRAVLFNCHMDTVPVCDRKLWKTDPFTLEKDEKNYYGLGVSDEKISTAITLFLIDFFCEQDLDIFLLYVTNEEVDGSGSQQVTEYFEKNYSYQKTYAIICEPRDAKYLGVGNKGSLFFELTAKGKAHHASEPEHGENAITALLKRIQQIHDDLKTFPLEEDIFTPATISFPTIIQGGVAINVIPSQAIAKGDIRTTSKTHDAFVAYLKKQPDIRIISNVPSCYQPSDNELVHAFEKQGITQKTITNGSNDMIFHTEKGQAAVVFGAGAEKACHIVNEFCPIKNCQKTIDIYKGVCEYLSNLKD
ncbi:MAG: M20 family metallopeptidase [Candidatus Woesearchaeota archaeon]